MFERFGEFDSYEEINRAAEGLKEEGDLDRELKRHTFKDITIGAHEYSVGLETELHALGGAYAGNRNQ